MRPIVERILARLEDAEWCEVNPHFQDDIRIAWLTVLHAARDDCLLCTPHVWATYMVVGLHPDNVWPSIVARREFLLGASSPPKKPVQSVRLPQRKAA
ncbi:MAG: hypothetical protein WBE45_09560 [Terriglobales bacterium]